MNNSFPNQKKLLLLGGLRYLLPVIKIAHKLGIYVITADYLPNNFAHKFSDLYLDVSILDKEAVLNLAKELKIDGIMSFAVDPGVMTAAYVAEKLSLPFQGSYEAVKILQNKDLFREFLKKNGFNVPKSKGFSDIAEAIEEIKSWDLPVIVKPVDSAGSKGVSKVSNIGEIHDAIKEALRESHSSRFIIEEFISPEGFPSDSECFSVDGNLSVCTFSDQYFDALAPNPFTPAAYVWPSSMEIGNKKELKDELQRLITLLQLKTGIYNVETRVGTNGKPYIMEMSPRGGGNRLAEMVDSLFHTKLIENSVRNAVGLPLLDSTPIIPDSYLAEVVIHTEKSGYFKNLEIAEEIKPYVREIDLWVKPGDEVTSFKGANNSLGTIVLNFPDQLTCKNNLRDLSLWLKVIID